MPKLSDLTELVRTLLDFVPTLPSNPLGALYLLLLALSSWALCMCCDGPDDGVPH